VREITQVSGFSEQNSALRKILEHLNFSLYQPAFSGFRTNRCAVQFQLD
jgi:hypothetical protein